MSSSIDKGILQRPADRTAQPAGSRPKRRPSVEADPQERHSTTQRLSTTTSRAAQRIDRYRRINEAIATLHSDSANLSDSDVATSRAVLDSAFRAEFGYSAEREAASGPAAALAEKISAAITKGEQTGISGLHRLDPARVQSLINDE